MSKKKRVGIPVVWERIIVESHRGYIHISVETEDFRGEVRVEPSEGVVVRQSDVPALISALQTLLDEAADE